MRGAGRVEVDELEQPRDLGAPLGAGARPAACASAMLSPMRHPRVERGVRVLEDHLERPVPAARAGPAAPSSRMRPAVQRREADRGPGQRGLAGAGLADQADDLAGRDGQAHAVDGGGGVP